MFRIAIQPDLLELPRSPHQSFSERWGGLLREAGHEAVAVDVLESFAPLQGCDGFMWWFPPLPFPRDAARRVMLALGQATKLALFPDGATCWHFDDKVAQAYLLQAASIPAPRTWVFWRYEEAAAFCRTAAYPLVLKLGPGFYSRNVTLLRSRAGAEHWLRRLFTSGVAGLSRSTLRDPRPALRAARERVRSLLGRPGRVPPAPEERGYVLLQEFVAGNDFDTRVTVIGERAFAFRRRNRPGDFRANGSGAVDFDPAAVDREALELAFRVARALRMQSVCMDVLRRGEERVVSEISYYYEGWAIAACPGHWRPDLTWVEGPVRAEDAILDDFLERVAANKNGAP